MFVYFLPRDAMRKHGLGCMPSHSVCPAGCRFHVGPIVSKRVIIPSDFLHQFTVLDFRYQTLWQYSDGDPHDGVGIECRGGVEKNCDL